MPTSPHSYIRSTFGLTQRRLHELFSFDTETRRLIWRSGGKAGKVAGYVQKRDRIRIISIDGHQYSANQLVFMYLYGSWPEHGRDGSNKPIRRTYPIHPELKD